MAIPCSTICSRRPDCASGIYYIAALDVPDATWADYDARKRKPIDAILEEASQDLAERLKAAILESEHVAIARRFREFIKARVGPEFYRTEAEGTLNSVTQ